MTFRNKMTQKWHSVGTMPKLTVLAGVLLLAFFLYPSKTPQKNKMDQRAKPVSVVQVQKQDVPIYLSAVGTAVPTNTTLIRSRVDGQLLEVLFTEGAVVQAGELLAVIDPKPFEVQRKQAQGALRRDEAILRDAKLTLARYRKLVKEGSVSAQQLQTQEAMVAQYEGAIIVDQANIDSAELQLDYCYIKAPFMGQLGLKKVDVGNMVRASDATGLVSLTQTDPMQVVFSLVERDIYLVLYAMQHGSLVVEAYGQGGKKLLATGSLASLDNQIDLATGTVKAKALFTGANHTLFANQFVDVKLLVTTEKNALTVPTAALQRDDKGFFVYRVQASASTDVSSKKESPAAKDVQKKQGKSTEKRIPAGGNATAPIKVEQTVFITPVTTGYGNADITIIEAGLAAGDIVVLDGADRLRHEDTVQYFIAEGTKPLQ